MKKMFWMKNGKVNKVDSLHLSEKTLRIKKFAKFIFSLKSCSSLGREYGNMKVRVQVDTVGRVAVSLKHILG